MCMRAHNRKPRVGDETGIQTLFFDNLAVTCTAADIQSLAAVFMCNFLTTYDKRKLRDDTKWLAARTPPSAL